MINVYIEQCGMSAILLYYEKYCLSSTAFRIDHMSVLLPCIPSFSRIDLDPMQTHTNHAGELGRWDTLLRGRD